MRMKCLVYIPLIAIILLSVPVSGQDWSQYQKDHENTGVVQEVKGNESWSHKTPEVLSPVVVSQGTAYYLSSEGLHSLDTESLETNWINSSIAPGLSSPVVKDSNVYISDVAGTFYSFNRSGNLSWKFKTRERSLSTPAVTEDVVYFSNTDAVYALKRESGRTVWRKELDGSVIFSPVVENSIYVGTTDIENVSGFTNASGSVYSLSTEDGTTNWRVNGSGVTTTPVVSEGYVFFGTVDGRLRAVDAETGTPVWNRSLSTSEISSPAIRDGKLYFGDGNGTVHAVDSSSGTIRWRFNGSGKMVLSPAVSEEMVYASNRQGTVYAVDADTGTEDWRQTLNETVRSLGVTATQQSVYIGGSKGVYAVSAQKGRRGESPQLGNERRKENATETPGQEQNTSIGGKSDGGSSNEPEGKTPVLYPLVIAFVFVAGVATYLRYRNRHS